MTTSRPSVLRALTVGRAKACEAQLDNLRGFVAKLDEEDVAWLRANDARAFTMKAVKLMNELDQLVSEVECR